MSEQSIVEQAGGEGWAGFIYPPLLFISKIRLSDQLLLLRQLATFCSVVYNMENSSEHYLPVGKSAKLAAENAFSKNGFNISNIEKIWDPD